MSRISHLLSLPLLVLLLLSLAVAPTAAASAVGVSIGLITLGDPLTLYLYHFSPASPPTPFSSPPISPTSSNSTVVLLNHAPGEESFIVSPPTPPHSTEWLMPLSSDVASTMIHYDPSSTHPALQVDQIHPFLPIDGFPVGRISHLLWSDAKGSYYALVEDDDDAGGDLFLSLYADVVEEVLDRSPAAVANVTLSVGEGHQVELIEQSSAMSQRRQTVFLLTLVWDEKDTTLGLLWLLDLNNGTVSAKPTSYSPDTFLWLPMLAYSEKRDALYATVAVYGADGSVDRLLVDRVDWVNGQVTHLAEALPLPDVGLDSLTVRLDDDAGELYVVYRSTDPTSGASNLTVAVINVDTKQVRLALQMSTNDYPMAVGLTYTSKTSSPAAPPQSLPHSQQVGKQAAAGVGGLSRRQAPKDRKRQMRASR